MPKQTSKVPTVIKKRETAKGAKGKKIAKPEEKTKKKKSIAKTPAAPKSTASSSTTAEPSTSRLGVGPISSSSAASLQLSETFVIAEKSHANPVGQTEIELIVKLNSEKDESSSEEVVTETASEKSDTDSIAPCSSKSIPQSRQPLSILENKWTLWLYMPKRGVSWEECQEPVYSFNTVEHFWSMYNHLIKPCELPVVADLALFKKDYRPMWEDAINKNGGRWLITLHRHRQKDVEDVWREASMFLIGEYYQYSDSVCGVVLSHRTYCDKIAIWTSNTLKHEVISIGNSAKRYMLLDFLPQMAFESHAQTQFNASTFGKASSKTVYKL